ncbi:hypothetical protein BC629DRAFT_1582009 [Irpex lacteus]|nr:hypothetical protein BC629DRAFT_1582009 [Irpex lacteus]
MASSASHKTSASTSQTHLVPPTPSGARPRRMTTPSLPPPPSPLDLPEPVTYGRSRPPSPLRQAITADPDTGELSEDGSFVSDEGDHAWGERPSSPSSSSMAKIANNFAQRFGSFVNNISANSSQHQLPTDEELEAEAERERERTRREAEIIMSREAQTRRLEERVLAMIDSDVHKMTPPLPPSTPSPASSPKEGSWLSTVKQRLTPTKEPLTPAQQIILETKVRDKEMEKEEKKLEKERKEAEKELKKQLKKQAKQRSGEWPSSPEGKFNDPTLKQLAQPQPQLPPPPPLRQMSSSPSPIRQHSMPPSLAPSPLRPNEPGSSSPARPGTPLYAQFNAQGALDVAATLLTIAGRFEKLERWTVSHVRALEERMDDVEKWLVEKEQEKEQAASGAGAINTHRTGEPPNTDAAISELRDELAEVQGRIGELGREMAKMVTSPGNLSSGPSRPPLAVNRAPSTSSSIAVRSMSNSIAQNHTPPRRQDSVSPVISTSPVLPASTPSRTRLPYPTGDYASPPDTSFRSQNAFSPPHSPPQADARRSSLSGLPQPSSDAFDFFSPSNGNSPSHSGMPSSSRSVTTSPPPLPPPPARAELRQASVSPSPTPRKRYTVALGDPIVSSSRDQSVDRPGTPHSQLGTAIFSSSPKSVSTSLDTTTDEDTDGAGEDEEEYDGTNEETIGKAAARHSGLLNLKNGFANASSTSTSDLTMPPPTQPLKRSRARPQSMYSGFTPSSSSHSISRDVASPRPITPLNTTHKLRLSRSTEKFNASDPSLPSSASASSSSSALPAATPTSARFVDPYLVRRQTKEAEAVSAAQSAPKVMPGKPKVPVGQLVAYFNKEKA